MKEISANALAEQGEQCSAVQHDGEKALGSTASFSSYCLDLLWEPLSRVSCEEHVVTISGDIKGMFQQVHLLR